MNKKEHILVTGANGQLGSELGVLAKETTDFIFFFTDVDELDITNKIQLQQFVTENKISTIINCAAYTNVDGAEEHQQLASDINYIGAKNIAEIAFENSIKFVHISTDYVFDGASSYPYKENDATNPQNVYGVTKLEGEKAILGINPSKTIIIRTSWLYSSFGKNFVKTMLKLTSEKEEISVVNDQVGSPTYAADLAKFVLSIVGKLTNKTVEVYHFANTGFCSWFEFASKIVEVSENSCKVKPISSEVFKSVAKRPKYSMLNTEKLEKVFQVKLPTWEDSLKTCIKKLV